jgi:hypothetical protein
MEEKRGRPDGRDHRFETCSVAIIAVCTAVFGWYLTLGRPDLMASRNYSNFFDLQARAIFHGRLSVPQGSLAYEGFVHGGRTYTYFGVFPSLLRAPVMLLTDRYDGRLTTLSMLAAYLVAMTSSVFLIRRVRLLAGRDGRWSTHGLAAALIVVCVIGIGSNLLFLGAGAWVYNEAELWGVAAALASFATLTRYLEEDRARDIAVAGIWAAVAWLSRGSVGLAPTAALGALAVVRLFPTRWLTPLAPPPVAVGPTWRRHRRRALQLAAAALVPMASFSAVNMAKFSSPITVPFGEQVGNHLFPRSINTLRQYGGNLFSARLVPVTLVQAVRPDLVKPAAQWPFLTFSRHKPISLDGVVFASVEPSAGLTATVPALIALGAVGSVAVFRRRRRTDRSTNGASPDLAPLRPFLIGGAAAAAVPLAIAFIAQRYWSDALPLLIVAAAAGVVVIDQVAAVPSSGHPRMAAAGLVMVATLAVFGIFVVLSTSWLFQRFVIPPDEAARGAALRTQAAIARTLHTPGVSLRRVDALPRRVVPGQIVVVGRCVGLYYGLDGAWTAVEKVRPGHAHQLGAQPSRTPTCDALVHGDSGR